MRSGLLCSAIVIITSGAFAGDVTYQLGSENDLLDAAFYNGGARTAWWGTANNAGTQVAFHAVEYPAFVTEIYLVNIGQPSSWTQLTSGFGYNPQEYVSWTPDDSALIIGNARIDVSTGAITRPMASIAGYDLSSAPDPTVTTKASNNWMVIHTQQATPGVQNLVALPVRGDGTEDTSRAPVVLTNFPQGTLVGEIDWPVVSADGTLISFTDYTATMAGTADHGDVYALQNVNTILSAPKLMGTDISSAAPTTLADANVVPLRVGESNNYAHGSAIAQDKSLVFWGEDFNNVFENADFFNTIAAASFDVMIGDSSGVAPDFQLVRTGNEGNANPTRGGTRLLYIKSVTAGALSGFENINFHLYITTLEVKEDLSTESTTVTEGASEATIDGQTTTLPFTTTDSAVQTTMEVEVSDASSTKINMPADQVINFPAGTTQKQISIVTPIEPTQEAQLPDDPFIDEIPVVRTFGPAGTQFFPPINVTMTYTDAEVGELDEAKLTPYLFNEATGKFDIKIPNETPETLGCVPCVFARDPANNTITFRVDHFSTYGLGGVSASNLPATNWAGQALLIVLLLAGGVIGAAATRRALT